MCRGRHKIFKICTGECVCVCVCRMCTCWVHGHVQQQRTKIKATHVEYDDGDDDYDDYDNGDGGEKARKRQRYRKCCSTCTHCFFEFNRRLFFYETLHVSTVTRVYMFSIQFDSHNATIFCTFALARARSLTRSTERNDWMSERQSERTEQHTIEPILSTFSERNQAVVINSFVDNKSMGVYVNLMFCYHIYTIFECIHLVVLTCKWITLWHRSINLPHNAACIVSSQLSLSPLQYSNAVSYSICRVYGNIFALFHFHFHLLNGMTCALLYRYHGFDELIFNCWQLVYQRTAQTIGFSLNMHDIWDTGHYESNRFVMTIEDSTSANYQFIRLNPYSLNWKWSVSIVFL